MFRCFQGLLVGVNMTKAEVQTTLKVLREVQATWNAKVAECDVHIASYNFVLQELAHEIRKRTKPNKHKTLAERRRQALKEGDYET